MSDWRRIYEYQRERVAALRRELIVAMGSKCRHRGCPVRDPAKLEFDHLAPRRWIARQFTRYSRLARYREDYERGELALACRHHNASSGTPLPLTDSLAKHLF